MSHQSREIAPYRTDSAPQRMALSRSSKSDYISRPKASDSDYISPSGTHSFSNHVDYSSQRTKSARRVDDEDYFSLPREKENYRIGRDDGWSGAKDLVVSRGFTVDRSREYEDARELPNEHYRQDALYGNSRRRTTGGRGQLEYYECDEDCINDAGDDGWIGSGGNEDEDDYLCDDGRKSMEDDRYYVENRRSWTNRIEYKPQSTRWDDSIDSLDDDDIIDSNDNQHKTRDPYADNQYPLQNTFTSTNHRRTSKPPTPHRYDTHSTHSANHSFIQIPHPDALSPRDTGFAGSPRYSIPTRDTNVFNDHHVYKQNHQYDTGSGSSDWTDGGCVNDRYADRRRKNRVDDGFVGGRVNDGGRLGARRGGRYGRGGYDEHDDDDDDEGWDECGDFDEY
jgi:hypothetical protein